ncbi:hypothetical protein F0562_015368 [Nyssa sinensis]|uniref:Uncharacterized protein n=1 Tax=Nyssa sinensis TaxID=561372 RepID=A0A5J4ZJA3_9ASTE|nr:hypothetical protein F0562_015368 [Nyssa sinensis]
MNVWENLVEAASGLLGVIGRIGKLNGSSVCQSLRLLSLTDREIVENLGDERAGKQLLVDEAKRNGDVVLPDAERWLKRVDAINEEAATIIEEDATVYKGCLKAWCPNLKRRHWISRKGKKKTDGVVKLIAEGKLISRLSCPPPPPGIKSTSIGNFRTFESRLAKMNEVMDALKDDNVNMIGICGMGGIGKTTMVKELGRSAKDEKLFDEVVMAVVSQYPNLIKIQDEIAVMLGLRFRDQTVPWRASQLHSRLQDIKRILVVLDDVWEKLDLEAIGIPFGSGHKGCKIMFTSRSQDVWSEIRTKMDIAVEVLTKKEAWHLFRETVGNSVETPDLRSVAEQIVKECGHLPLALVTIGGALIHKNRHVWNDMLRQLRMPSPRSISSGVPANVYRSLELSYNYLEDEEAKSCFLLCCLFPEDSDIPIETLVRYGMGLQLFEGINMLEETRDRVHALAEKLRGCFLLLDGHEKESVRMHDVVRNVAMSIASKDEHGFMMQYNMNLKELPEKIIRKRCASISVVYEETNELLEGFGCPVLELLLLKGVNSPGNLFKGMSKLKVLEMRDMPIPSLPSSLVFLKNLRTLYLVDCSLENISIIGALEKLEILSLLGSLIKELPKEIGQLTNLRLLDLTYCESLKKISPGVMSSFSRLKELYMKKSFMQWEVGVEGKERSNLCLTELDSLAHLNVLEIHVPDPKLLPEILFLKNLKRYKISIGDYADDMLLSITPYEKNLALCLFKSTSLESGIQSLLKSATSLFFTIAYSLKNVLNELVQDGFLHLKYLSVRFCDTPEYLANAMDFVPHAAFPVLESLSLYELPNLKEICHGQLPSGSFEELRKLELSKLPALMHLWKGLTQGVCLGNLRVVKVSYCDSMGYLFSQSTATGLGQLKSLTVYSCKKMEEIVLKERGEDQRTNKIEFPKLNILNLGTLPGLTGFCKGVDEIAFPQLEIMNLCVLPTLKSFCPVMSSLASGSDHNATLQYLFNQKVKLTSLKKLHVSWMDNLTKIWCGQLHAGSFYELNVVKVFQCNNLLNVFPLNLIQRLQNLEELEVQYCKSLEAVFDFDGINPEEGHAVVLLPRFKTLELKNLPNLTDIWKKNLRVIEGFENLKLLKVYWCDSLRVVFSPSIAKLLVKLQELEIVDCTTLEEIVADDQDGGENNEVTGSVVIPGAKKRVLDALPNFTSFFPGKYCKSKEEVVANDRRGGEDKDATDIIMFPGVKNLILAGVPRLTSFCLERKTFALTSLSTQTRNVGFEEVLHHCLINKQVAFPSLEVLELCQAASLEGMSNDQLPGGSLSKSVKKLRRLEIRKCAMMSEIITGDNGQGESSMDIIEFPQLSFLRLNNLPNLASFFPKVVHMAYEYPRNDNPKEIDGGSGELLTDDDLQTAIQPLFNDKVAFPSLEVLELCQLSNINEIWGRQLPNGLFCKLRVLKLDQCEKLLIAAPFDLLKVLPNLEEVQVANCTSIEEVFEINEQNTRWSSPSSRLRELTLSVLPRLVHLCKKDHQAVLFENLVSLSVVSCKSLRNLLSFSMARGLVNLQKLKIDDCLIMEEVVGREEGKEQEEEAEEKIFFPQLNQLELMNLPKLRSFLHVIYALEWPLLENVTVNDCPELKTLSMGSLSTPKLKSVKVTTNEQLVLMGDLNNTIQHLHKGKGDPIRVAYFS